MLIALALAGVATLAGLIHLWPNHDAVGDLSEHAEFAVEGVTFPEGRITQLDTECEPGEMYEQATAPAIAACQIAHVEILDGEFRGDTTTVFLRGSQAHSDLRTGDTLVLMHNPSTSDHSVAEEPESDGYSVFGINRNIPLSLWALAFIIIVTVIGLHRGFLALIALGLSGLIIVNFVLPGLLSGGPGIAIALVGSSAIMYVALYLAHGPSIRTSAALAGTLLAVVLTAVIAHFSVSTSRLSGLSDEESGILSSIATQMDFQGLLTCAIIIAGLGILNDVTITQTSSVWELRAAAPTLSRREIFAGAMRIGRDHIASTIYTIVFAYTGAALTVLLLLYLYDQPILNILSQDQMALEIIRTLTSGIGLVLAVPITTAIAAVLLPPQQHTPAEKARHVAT